MFLNDQLGDCTCAGVYHARQVWSANANPPMKTEVDQYVEEVYEQACGYKPGDSSTDQGGNEQDVLTYWANVGVPVYGNPPVDRLLAFLEIDPQNNEDVKRAIYECGVVYIGVTLPNAFIESLDNGNVPETWDVSATDTLSDEGHCVILAAFNEIGPKLISWGQVYQMTWAFFDKCCDEAYALADASWITAKGTSPGGLTIAHLEEQMQALKI